MAIVLLLTTEDDQAVEFPVLKKCVVGRSRSCDLTIKDSNISAKHGIFEFNEKNQLLYRDLGSTNGSYLNNSKIQKVQLKINETLLLGTTRIKIDEKRLTKEEKLAIGHGIIMKEKTSLVPPSLGDSTLRKPKK
jgi:pSer/pThr/pTyr-binding forkhead associated (FHA) protein